MQEPLRVVQSSATAKADRPRCVGAARCVGYNFGPLNHCTVYVQVQTRTVSAGANAWPASTPRNIITMRKIEPNGQQQQTTKTTVPQAGKGAQHEQ